MRDLVERVHLLVGEGDVLVRGAGAACIPRRGYGASGGRLWFVPGRERPQRRRRATAIQLRLELWQLLDEQVDEPRVEPLACFVPDLLEGRRWCQCLVVGTIGR